jgi:hypothetical protein
MRQARAYQLALTQLVANRSTLDPLEPTPPPAAHLPFDRDTDFEDDGTIDIIKAKLASQQRVALVGLGGVGYVTFHCTFEPASHTW